jgi:Fe-S-cluster containining protein
VFIDHEEGRALFPERSTWQARQNYPALRVIRDDPRHPCRFYDIEAGACTVYEIRPEVCRRFLCDSLRHLISLV